MLIWILCAMSFFAPPSPGSIRAQYLFFGLLIAHGAECLVFRRRIRAAGGSLASHVLQTMLFGFFHVRTLPPA
jgi:uncharacterized protein YhhL (DUF1145 family)